MELGLEPQVWPPPEPTVEASSGPFPGVSILPLLSLLDSLEETPSPINITLADLSLNVPSNPGR